ncbi:MAG: tetratricopeptide repeat protein [Chitinophagaceae bacterium]|nr:MAG: tetratricopeptide repeat protein [Chitinophagaceae bacterium]
MHSIFFKLKFQIYSLLCLLLAANATGWAQPARLIDSLQKQLDPATTSIKQVNILNRIAFLSASTDSSKTFAAANKAIQQSTKLNYLPGLAKANEAKANYHIFRASPAKATPFLEEATKLWQRNYDDEGMAGNLHLLGQVSYLLMKYSTAIEQYQRAEKLYAKTNNKHGLSTVYHSIGTAYNDKGDKDLAVEYLLKSLKLQEQLADKSQLRSTQNNLGRVLVDVKNYPEAIRYYEQSMQTSLQNSDWRNLGITQVNVANIYANQSDYKSAVSYLENALVNLKKADYRRGIQAVYNNLGAINLRLGNYDQAILQLNAALDHAKASQSLSGVALIEQNIAYGYAGLKKYDDALAWYNKAEATAISSGADPFTFGEIYNHRASLDSAMSNYASALNYRTRFVNVNNQVLNEKISKQVLELQTKYDTEKKEYRINMLSKSDSIKSLQIANQQLDIKEKLLLISNQNLSLLDASLQMAQDSLDLIAKSQIILQNELEFTQKQKIIQDLDKQKQIQTLLLHNKSLEVSKKNFIIIGISVVTLLLGLYGYSFYKKRSLQQKALMQAELAKQQEAATIAILTAEEKERKRIASDLHDGVGQLMTAAWLNLQAAQDQLPTQDAAYGNLLSKTMLLVNESMKEVRAVSHNMMPNALLKKGLVNAIKEFIHQLDAAVISINLQTDGLKLSLPSHTETILYRVIQESVNNVVKHAGASRLDISIFNDAAGTDVLIEDNGKGFDVQAALAKENGLGLQNIVSRIQYLHGTVDWDSTPGNGTVIAIHIPAEDNS